MQRSFDAGQPSLRFAFRARARPSASRSIFEVIEQDHRMILRLFDAVMCHAEGDDERRDLFDQLRRELLSHSRAEEEVSYPTLASTDSAVVARSLEEHREFDAAVERLARAPFGGAWERGCTALRAAFLSHARTERDTLFQRARGHLSDAEQLVLGSAFEASHDRHLRELGAAS